MSHYFFAAGTPVAQGSKKHVGNGRMVESAKGLPAWRKAVALAAAGSPLIHKPKAVTLAMVFVMPRPKATPRKTPPAVKRPDIDKISRAVADALTGVCYEDDSQIIYMFSEKRLAEVDEPAGVHVHVEEGSNEEDYKASVIRRGQG